MAATTTNRALSQYSGDTPAPLFIRDVPDWIPRQRRGDTPFINKVGRAGAPTIPMLKAEWGWGSLDPVQDQLNGALTNVATTVIVDNASYFQVGHIIKVDDEQMRVTAVAAPNLTVVRAYNGDLTTGVSHLDDSKVEIVGLSMPENVDDPLSPVTQGEVDFNYHSLYQMGWQFSDRAAKTPTYESKGQPGDRFQQELKKKMQYTAPITLERECLFGTRNLGSTTAASSFGGLAQPSFVTSRINLNGNPLTEFDLLEAINGAWNLMGSDGLGRTIFTSMFTKRAINSWYNGTRRSSPTDSRMNLTWDTITTDMGDFGLDVDHQFDITTGEKDNLYLLNYDDFQLRPYASGTGWQTGEHATNGPYRFGFLRGDWTLLAQKPDSRIQLYGYSTLSTDYAGFA